MPHFYISDFIKYKSKEIIIVMKLYSFLKFFGLQIILILKTANACLKILDDAFVVRLYPEDLDFIELSNFSVKKKQIQLVRTSSDDMYIQCYCREKLKIQIIVCKSPRPDYFFIERDLNIIVKIAKEYIRMKLYDIECSRAYQRVFLVCALYYGITNYKKNNFVVMSDNKCINVAKEIQFLPEKRNNFRYYMDSNIVFNMYFRNNMFSVN